MSEIPNQVGEDIHDVAGRAVVVAVDADEPVWFEFNGVQLVADKNDTAEAVVSRFRKA
jgi:hypothetical protein